MLVNHVVEMGAVGLVEPHANMSVNQASVISNITKTQSKMRRIHFSSIWQ
jgi:hypothetical protein